MSLCDCQSAADANAAFLYFGGGSLRGSPSWVRKCSRARRNDSCTDAGLMSAPVPELDSRSRSRRSNNPNDGWSGPVSRNRSSPPRIDSNTASTDLAPRRVASRIVRSRGPAERVLTRHASACSQRPIERLVNEAGHLGFVCHLETRIQIGFEWELTQQRQAEGVDGAGS